MPAPRSALDRFRVAYSEMLLAAAELRLSLDPAGAGDLPDDLRQIQTTVAAFYRIDLARFLSRSREYTVAPPRQVAMVLCRELTQHSTTVIGAAFGRDAGTISHAQQAIEARCATDPLFASRMELLRTRCRAVLALPLAEP